MISCRLHLWPLAGLIIFALSACNNSGTTFPNSESNCWSKCGFEMVTGICGSDAEYLALNRQMGRSLAESLSAAGYIGEEQCVCISIFGGKQNGFEIGVPYIERTKDLPKVKSIAAKVVEQLPLPTGSCKDTSLNFSFGGGRASNT